MKLWIKASFALIIGLIFMSCVDNPNISVPEFIEKSMPYELEETGIDAHYENAIYLEWEEPATREAEGILGYYLYRGTFQDGEYSFDKVANVVRESIGNINPSDSYVDYTVNLDTTYYYYLRSYNDFGVSRETSDTAYFQLVYKANLYSPLGDVTDNKTRFYFSYGSTHIDDISYLYMRLFYNDNGAFRIKYFTKSERYDLSNGRFYVYLDNSNSHVHVLTDNLSIGDDGKRYLEKGQYKWRVDAVSTEPDGVAETQGSESNWGYFEVK